MIHSAPEIYFNNTLSGTQERFFPLDPAGKKVGMYTCGPTVYDYAHMGNFRAFVFEDLLRRFLEYAGYEVRHVMNLTDVDDKTIAGAGREGKTLQEYTAHFSRAFNEDLEKLNCLKPQEQPRATQKIPQMLDLIGQLIQKGAAYESNGSVYFCVAQFPGYGKLSKKKLEMNIAGASARVDVDEYDRDQICDFVLWKKSRAGEPSWPSPWGPGRPGWHIECSAMSMECLGPTFDFHAGGEDLIFPHHENEIAQSEAATGKLFVRFWLHCKFLFVDGKKMSKSMGNFYTLRDLLKQGYDPMAVRYLLLGTHYRSPLNFTLEGLKEAGEIIRKLDDCFWQCVSRLDLKPMMKKSSGYEEMTVQTLEEMKAGLANDLNIAACLSVFFRAVTRINKEMARMGEEELRDCLNLFKAVDALLGLNIVVEKKIPGEIIQLVNERSEVRRRIKEENNKTLWPDSDKLRDQIQSLGWIVKDGRPGELSTLKMKRRVWDV